MKNPILGLPLQGEPCGAISSDGLFHTSNLYANTPISWLSVLNAVSLHCCDIQGIQLTCNTCSFPSLLTLMLGGYMNITYISYSDGCLHTFK